MGKAKSHFSRSPIPASFSSTLNVRFHGPLGDVIARSRVFRFSNTLETTRNEADNFWCSLLTYFFLFFCQVDTSKGNSYHVWESEKNLKSCCLVNSSVLSLMNMFGIGQCKTRTTDYCFSTCKWERDNNSPTLSHLKNNGSQSLRSLHFKLPRLVFYAWVYAFITPGDAQIKFEASFLQKQNQRRLTDFTKALLLFRFLEISRLAMVNGHLH